MPVVRQRQWQSSSTPLLPNSLVGVSETVVFDDGSSILAEDIPSTSYSTALLPNTPIDVSESEDRESRNTSFDNKIICFFCGRDRKQIKGKQQSLHSSNDAKVYEKITEWVTKLQNQELLHTINNLKVSNAPIFYHHSCEVGYFNDYKKITVNTVRTSWHSVRDIHKDIFDKIVSVIEEDVVKKRNYLLLTSYCDMYNNELQEELIHQPEADVSLMTNHQLEEKIVKQFKQIKIVIKKKRKIIMHKNSTLLEQEDLKTLEENDLIDKVAFILRSTILKMDKTTLPAIMMM
ncbi:hypothetical protein TNIN_456241 [Trichonephila inaurata madagascariensis]|uniref:Uncharacterized protein n=1 Tax=Trichonephila inaurata madagascariensis TaxID=2747483 RepID=A0A8X6X931_9ARAC|nr:hypothetical protein TNIN_456241 [Trichonephila inaurata madagascariensis]